MMDKPSELPRQGFWGFPKSAALVWSQNSRASRYEDAQEVEFIEVAMSASELRTLYTVAVAPAPRSISHLIHLQ